MKAALLLIDLQNDFLARPTLEPSPELLVARAATLLGTCRAHRMPIVHVRMTTTREPDNRLPHWRRDNRWTCLDGSHGHAFPAPLEPRPGELVLDKPGFSGFENIQLEPWLAAAGIDTVLVAGLYVHNCVRATAVDAWRSGRAVVLVEDAVGQYDPLEAETTTAYLRERGLQFLTVRALAAILSADRPATPAISATVPRLPVVVTAGLTTHGETDNFVHQSPSQPGRILWTCGEAGPADVASAVTAARVAGGKWRSTHFSERVQCLRALQSVITDAVTVERLADFVARDVGKPIRDARAEVARCGLLLDAAIRHADSGSARPLSDGSTMRQVPLGTVAVLTPWNHPLAIAVGKIAPAVLYGNTVVWKPAPAASRLAVSLMELVRQAGWPDNLVTLVIGGTASARLVMGDPGIDAITLTGGPAAGQAAQRFAALRHVPLQAELGGNNATIVWTDANHQSAAGQIAAAAFGFAGQRCTANRRVIVERSQVESFVQCLGTATRALTWGDPLDETTVVGPVISEDSRERVQLAIEEARHHGCRILTPHGDGRDALPGDGWYVAPVIVVCPDAQAGLVQRESFGPVLVVQPADSWDHAIDLVNGVPQGLVAAVFTESADRWRDFQDRALAGILKWNRATADAGVEAPFGGWKASGVGPPEHGPAHAQFFSRTQAIYTA